MNDNTLTETKSSDWQSYFEKHNRFLCLQAQTHAFLIQLILIHADKNAKILEAGCGTAILSGLLSNAGLKVTAMDLEKDVIDHAKNNLKTKKNNLKFETGNLFELINNYSANEFDIICHSGVLEHFSDEKIVDTLKQQKIISKKVIFKIPNSRTKMGPSHFGDERFLPNSKWYYLIKNAGFTDITIYGGEALPKWTYFLPHLLFLMPKSTHPRKLRKVLLYFMRLRRHFSLHSIFVCQ